MYVGVFCYGDGVLCVLCMYVLGLHPCRLCPIVPGNMRELDTPIVLDGQWMGTRFTKE